MPMGEYKDFADCVGKNKGKDDPNAYCGYIKNQIEGSGKKKDEALYEEEHEAYHLEETIRGEEGMYEDKTADDLALLKRLSTQPSLSPFEEGLVQGLEKKYYGDVSGGDPAQEQKGEEAHQSRYGLEKCPHGLPVSDCATCGVGAPESEITLQEASAFMTTLEATVDTVMTLKAAKDNGYNFPTTKVSPTDSFYKFNVQKQELADVVVKQSKGFETEVGWFNATLEEMKDIVKSADKFFTDAGWNSKETVKEYNAHKKKWGKDWF
jgi:hypothetical protein